ncbi:transcriptional repressor [candidate division KSB1 bacterium]|nr:transcriptional repressor [candidate division KSB1 bacterium]
MDKLKQMLVESGIKPTYQRIKVLEYFQQNNNHPTVDMIFAALYRKVPTLSRTTIYNALDVFKKHGLISVLTITGSELRYEYRTKSHHHFLCRICGNIIDMDVKCPFQEKKNSEGHQIEEIHGYFKGVCKECLKNMPQEI